MTEEELDQVERIIHQFECGLKKKFMEYENNSQFRILFPNKLFQDCEQYDNDPNMPKTDDHDELFSWMTESIQNVVSTI